jgi:hypothetical protein
MKRVRLLIAGATAVLALSGASAQQFRIYDTIWAVDGPPTSNLAGLTFTGATPRYNMGDGIGVNLSSPAQLVRFDFVLVVATAVSNASVQFTVDIFNDWTIAGEVGDPAFSNLAGSFNGVVSGITTTGATAFIITATPNNPIILNPNPNKGVVIKLLLNNAVSNDVTVGIVNRLPNPGSEGLLPDAFYRDANGDGIIQIGEARTFGDPRTSDNLAIALWVPEPASMVALGVGLAGLLALRRRSN